MSADPVVAVPSDVSALLQKLHLKTLCKESHGQSTLRVCFNRVDADKQHLFATVGGVQATVYDNEHFVRYINVVEQFVNTATEHAPGGELLACCWLSSAATTQVHGDALLAVGGKDSCVSVLSLACCAVIRLLKGHTQAVVDVAATASGPRMVASISRDGTAKVWDYVDGKCIWTMPVADGTCIAWSVDGATLLVGTSHGSISAWTLPAQSDGDATILAPETYCTPFSGGAAAHGQCRVDCLCMLTRDRLASKSSDGKCCIWDISKPTLAAMVTSFREPGAAKAGANQVGCTPCGSVLLIGSNTGDVSAWSTVDGSKLGTLQGGKSRATVCAVAATHGCANVLVAYANGVFARYEEVKSQAEIVEDDEADMGGDE